MQKGFFVGKIHMSTSSNMSSSSQSLYPTFQNKMCLCGLRAALKISESTKNPGRLYYRCPKEKKRGENECNYWEWCYQSGGHHPTLDVPEDSQAITYVRLPEDTLKMKDKLLKLKDDELELKVQLVEINHEKQLLLTKLTAMAKREKWLYFGLICCFLVIAICVSRLD